MLFCAALVACITGAFMLLLLCQDWCARWAKAETEDRMVDCFMLVGFVCTVIVSGYVMLERLAGF